MSERRLKRAIVRIPGRSIRNALSAAGLGPPDYRQARKQHRAYVHALEKAGLDVEVLDPLEDYPDSTFVEDTAFCTTRGVILTRPGARSRRGEVSLIEPVLQKHFEKVERINGPGTLDAGDILTVGSLVFIGLSSRTNSQGASQLLAALRNQEMDGVTVSIGKMLHLKSGVAYLEGGTLVAVRELVENPRFAGFHVITVPDKEAYAANCVWVNGRVLVSRDAPETRRLIEAAGYETLPLDMSEFRKADGGLSCLSLRF